MHAQSIFPTDGRSVASAPGPMPITFVALTIVAALTVACVDGTLPPRSVDDPSNPNAPEAPTDGDAGSRLPVPVSTAERDAPTPPAHRHRPLSAPASSPSGSP